MECRCSLCRASADSESAAILTMTKFAVPKYLCQECENDLENATRGIDIALIEASIDKIYARLRDKAVEDELVINEVAGILKDATDRLELIKSGEYDPEADCEEEYEIPEELLESEEDRELDRIEEEKNKKLDKVYNWVLWGAIIGCSAYIIYRLIKMFFL